MKNITISVDDEIYRLARIKAAEQSTSISALVKAFIVRLTDSDAAESEFQRLYREEQDLRDELRTRRLSLNPAHNLSRTELHDRHAQVFGEYHASVYCGRLYHFRQKYLNRK